MCHYSLDLSFSPKISVKIPFHALRMTRIQPGHLWKTALESRECKRYVANIQLPSTHQLFIQRGTRPHKDIYWSQPGPSGNFILLQIPLMLLSYLSPDLQITVHLLSSSSTVLCTVYAYDLYNLYCFYIVYTELYAG